MIDKPASFRSGKRYVYDAPIMDEYLETIARSSNFWGRTCARLSIKVQKLNEELKQLRARRGDPIFRIAKGVYGRVYVAVPDSYEGKLIEVRLVRRS